MAESRCVKAGGTTLFATTRVGGPPTLLLLHGNSGGHQLFDRLVAEPVLSPYRCVCLDLPGHGRSHPAPPDRPLRYGLVYYAESVAEAADALGAADGLCFGFSLGGHILLEALGRGWLPRVRGVMVQGAPPLASAADFATAFESHPAMAWALEGSLSDDQIAQWGAAGFGPNLPAPAWFAAGVRATDPEARPTLAAALAHPFVDEVAVVARSPIPIAVVHAACDAFIAGAPLRRLAGLGGLWRGQVQVLPDTGHYAPWERPKALAALLAALASDVGGPP